MNKPLSMIIKETKTQIINTCNESGLSPAILDLILHGVYLEVHGLSEKQIMEEEMLYKESLIPTMPMEPSVDSVGEAIDAVEVS